MPLRAIPICTRRKRWRGSAIQGSEEGGRGIPWNEAETLGNIIARVEPMPVKLWDMRVRASAQILKRGVQNNLIEEVEKYRGRGRS